MHSAARRNTWLYNSDLNWKCECEVLKCLDASRSHFDWSFLVGSLNVQTSTLSRMQETIMYVHFCVVSSRNEISYLLLERHVQYIPKNMHTVFALLCFVVVIHWLISPYPSGLLHWHCGNLTIAPVPAKQPWWIWINTSCEFIMNDCITTTKQRITKPCAYFLGYTVSGSLHAILDIMDL